MPARPAKPPESPWMAPYLTVRDPDAALAFYQKAFGFDIKFKSPGMDGKTGHAELVWKESSFMLGGEALHNHCEAPATTGTRPSVSLYVYCDDVDALFERAVGAGAKGELPPQGMYWGDRMCTLIDPDGHIWNFATNVADYDPSKAPKA